MIYVNLFLIFKKKKKILNRTLFSFIAASGGIKMEATPILKAPSHCGYSVRRGKDGAINVLLPYSSCHMTQKVCDVINCYANRMTLTS